MERAPKPEDHQDEQEEEAEGERHVTAMQKFVGFVMLVLGWLQLLLALSSGSEATSIPFLIFFAGVVIFLSGAVTSWYKYPLMLAATIAGLALHYHIQSLGAATHWEKAVIVYGTIIVVAYFILFAKKPIRRINLPPSSPQPPITPPQG
ncbi:MAG: hypothetical protein E6K68_05820 [Nitrospirae bacterium]|nr:MAG: hypothetical protein E6K68_05820 [Nitrospirota bacterium]